LTKVKPKILYSIYFEVSRLYAKRVFRLKTVKEMTQEYISTLEVRIKEYDKQIQTMQIGLQNLKDELEKEKQYLATL